MRPHHFTWPSAFTCGAQTSEGKIQVPLEVTVTEVMTQYDAAAYRSVQDWKALQERKKDRLPVSIRKGIDKTKSVASTGWSKVPGSELAGEFVMKAVEGMHELVTETAAHSVQESRVVAMYVKAGHRVGRLADIRALDLADVDAVRPALRLRYMAGMGGSGAVAGAVSGGATVVATAETTASAGAGAVPGVALTAGVMAMDVVTTLASATRLIARVAAFYGYDVKEEGEKAFAMAVLGLSAAGEATARQAAWAQLHKLVGQLARDATWKELNKDAFVQLTRATFTSLGEKLTKRKLGQAVPGVGALLGLGLNSKMASDVATAANMAYRERYLVEKYGLASGDGV